MELINNIPFIIFNLVFFVIFISFVFGAVALLFSKGDFQKIEKGKRVILKSLYYLMALLLAALVFFAVSYLVKKGEALKPPPASEDFPLGPFSLAPPPPDFINVAGYYFSGPWLIEKAVSEKNIFRESELAGLYLILCKKNEEYDIIYIGVIGNEILDYQCWLENCQNSEENIYLAALKTDRGQEIMGEIKKQIDFPCGQN